METGILIAYYAKPEDWLHVCRLLERRNYRQYAGASRDAAGKLRLRDPFPVYKAAAACGVAMAFGLMGFGVPLILAWLGWIEGSALIAQVGGVAGIILGWLLVILFLRRSEFGIESELLKEHAGWLIPNESILIVRTPVERLHLLMPTTSEDVEVPPAVFVLHPLRSRSSEEVWRPPPLSLGDLREHGARLGRELLIDKDAKADARLLRQIDRSRKWLRRVSLDLEEANRLKQSVPPSAEWLLDNQYIVESKARIVRKNLPVRYLRQLPVVANGNFPGTPRVYALARELAGHTDLRLDPENITEFIQAYQSEATLTIGELWALPQMLRVAILENIRSLAAQAHAELRENEVADLWANRLVTLNRMEPNRLFAILGHLTSGETPPSAFFASQLVDYLYDDEAAMTPVRTWVERLFHKPLQEVRLDENRRQARDQVSIGNAFTSLRQLTLLDWRDLFEELSKSEALLREDPAGIYPRMDFETRNRCRAAVEQLRVATSLTEEQIVGKVLAIARANNPADTGDERDAHVGTYLIGHKRESFGKTLNACETKRFRGLCWIESHHTAVYFGALLSLTAVFALLALWIGLSGQPLLIRALAGLALLIPASQLALEIVNFLVTQLVPPRVLPKMDFQKSGIPDEFRTLVVVPVLLPDPDTARVEVEKLEIRYLANREENLLFGLFADYKDADQMSCEEDESLLAIVRSGIEDLNHRHGEGRFFLFVRERTWCESEQKFIGWERKRGKLEELNGLLAGTRAADAESLVHAGDAAKLGGVRFVLTLDSDTQLPHHAARRLVETLAHPLNRPRFDEEGRVTAGYTVIQPRVESSLPSAMGSPFSRLFSNPVGVDPYTNAVSDVYQDLTGEGSYQGKGIYDVEAFNRALAGRFPESWLLSHDLIEGAHVRSAYASDIELFDEFPRDYRSFAKREHRWIRGDWQIMDWIMPRVPLPEGGRGANPVSWFNRWKIFDNLRRSLLPLLSIVLLTASWFVSPGAAIAAAAIVIVQMLFNSFVQPLLWALRRRGADALSLRRFGHDAIRIAAEVSLLPSRAVVILDAIGRVLYRRHVSRRKLLEWTTAQAAQHEKRTVPFQRSMIASTAFAVAVGWAIIAIQPSTFWIAAPWLGLWFVSPMVGWLLDRQPRTPHPRASLRHEDRVYLRHISRLTWRFFSDFVNEKTSWLPPDNYQVSYQDKLAMRTSPTNIGFAMASVYGACEMGYLTLEEASTRLTQTMKSLHKLERHEGHLLNWYDIGTLRPLEPRYLSAVDSGNLIGALWVLDAGLDKMTRGPVLDVRACHGLRDTAEVLFRLLNENGISRAQTKELVALMSVCSAPHPDVAGVIRVLRRFGGTSWSWTVSSAETQKQVDYWTGQLRHEFEAWLAVANDYLGWMEILNEKEKEGLLGLDVATRSRLHSELGRAPSLWELSEGNVPFIRFLQTIPPNAAGASQLHEWIARVRDSFEKAQRIASERLVALNELRRQLRELGDSMNMRFLYNEKRRLFSIGYNVTDGRLDNVYYDLLASEARLGSFVAIARGDVPYDHWFALGRPYGAVGRHRILLSWTGTMFEYMMPLLFHRTYGNSLLDKATREAVQVHVAYGRRLGIPWGISESAFGDLDAERTYQYQAFGVPELALRHETSDKTVVTPYATMLALEAAPQEAVENLKKLASLNLLNEYGFYEAIDFSRQPGPGGQRGVVVRTYMAHHQGMSFLALANLLLRDPFRERFHEDPRVRASEPLLQERIPFLPSVQHLYSRNETPTTALSARNVSSASHFQTPHTAVPKTQLLSNGRMALMVTSAGGGYVRWRDIELTRWRSDRTRDARGTFCYIREARTGRLWCNTYHPVGGKAGHYCANFPLDRAVFKRRDRDIESETEIVISPEDDVEIRRITLRNRSHETRQLELTSYVELSMAQHNADRQHPAFNKLFIETEAIPELRALVARRRHRGGKDPVVFVAHRLVSARADDSAFRFETDRRRFIGRGRTLANPMGVTQEPGNSQGFVLDPILSIRRTVQLAPGERVEVSMLLAAADTQEKALGMLDKYGDPRAIDRAMDLVWNSAQLELRLLRIQPDDARRFQQLASHILYPNELLRPPAASLSQNRKGQAGLWKYAISGDLPIVVVAVGESRDLGLVRQVLQAHAFWRLHGLAVDLIILNEEGGSYERPLSGPLGQLVQAHAGGGGPDQRGRIHVLASSQIPTEDLTLFRAAASVVLVAARGTLSQQFGVVRNVPNLPEAFPRKADNGDASPPLPFLELAYFNSLGGFNRANGEYAIYLGPNIHTPAPWVNVMANPMFGTLVSETGAGFTWFGNSQRNRLTEWSNDPVLDPASEAIYIRDEESGVYWSPTASPIREDSAYRARHGAGYTVFEHNSHGIEQELTVFVPMDDSGGTPVKIHRLTLNNVTGRTRLLSVTFYVEWVLGEAREASQMHVVTNWDAEARAMTARNRYNPDYPERIAYVSMHPAPDSFTADRTLFIGRNRSMANPAAMERRKLSRQTGAGLDPCGALQTTVRLAPGERVEVVCLLGAAESIESVHASINTYRTRMALDKVLDRTKKWWGRLLGTVRVQTPDLAADLLINHWLLYQSLSCRIWGRSAFYQSGGAFGFRDQLQDVMAFLLAHPKVSREMILQAARHQFKEGDVQHWWHPPGDAGIRSRISDDLLWLPYVTAQYVRVTGDATILDETVPFLEAPLLESHEHESFRVPTVSSESGTLFEHCRRAVAQGFKLSARGLPLMGTGDWNDGMNLVGAEGKGESVWLAWFLVDVLDRMAELSRATSHADLSEEYLRDRAKLVERIEALAWDGAWYLRATFDDGTPLGSSASPEAQIDSLPQSWATITAAGDPQRADQALESAWEHLVHEEEKLILLFEPPFDKSEPSPGYIKGYPPGVRENGGQYTHAALWLVMAMARRGHASAVEKMLRMLNPVEHARDPESVWRYGIEPYVIAADVYRLPGRVGQGGWSWYTGSAAWLYRVWVEEVLGLKVSGETLRIAPVIPGWWDEFRMEFRHGETVYDIHVENPDHRERGVAWIEVDGVRVESDTISLDRKTPRQAVTVRLGGQSIPVETL